MTYQPLAQYIFAVVILVLYETEILQEFGLSKSHLSPLSSSTELCFKFLRKTIICVMQ